MELAINSAREVMFALRIAETTGYIDQPTIARELDNLDRIIAILWKLTYRRST